jgi:ABC-type transporter Mla subunit MlaD
VGQAGRLKPLTRLPMKMQRGDRWALGRFVVVALFGLLFACLNLVRGPCTPMKPSMRTS